MVAARGEFVMIALGSDADLSPALQAVSPEPPGKVDSILGVMVDSEWLFRPAWYQAFGTVAHRVWLGFHTEVSDPPPRTGFEHYLFVPCRFLAAVSAVLPVRAVGRWRTAHRGRLVGRCRRCRYDLRATPGRCPECGTAAAATPAADAVSSSS